MLLKATYQHGAGMLVVDFRDGVGDGNAAGVGGAGFRDLDEALDEPRSGLAGGDGSLEEQGVIELSHKMGEVFEELRGFGIVADGFVRVDPGEVGGGLSRGWDGM